MVFDIVVISNLWNDKRPARKMHRKKKKKKLNRIKVYNHIH